MSQPGIWSDPTLEEKVNAAVNLDEPWALVERFSTLVRESGSEDERRAAQYIAERLEAFGVQYTVHEPELFLSVPKSARLTVKTGAGERDIRAKTPAFSVSTGDASVSGDLLYLPSGQAEDLTGVFDDQVDVQADIAGKIILTEGYPMPGKVHHLEQYGVKALIFIAPGRYIHEAICTPIWGAPDLHNMHRQPGVPVIAVNKEDGQWLAQQVEQGSVQATVGTVLDEGWMTCPLVEAVIPGTEDPDKFVLIHGHIDSWHVGIGDNATGDATLLELARVLHAHRDELKRTVKICWWPGHSTGRYAGSTWYADTFALELDANCIVHLNCDSPGCRDATVYEDVTCMPETEDVAFAAIKAATGKEATGDWPLRAGDISFNNLGLSTFFMLLSSIPEDVREQKGLWAVGGCGGNVEWHTEDDTIEVANRDVLLDDMRIYATAAVRVANAPIVPLDYRRTVDALVGYMDEYARGAGGKVDFSKAKAAAEQARGALAKLYEQAEALAAEGRSAGDARLAAVNDAILRAGRPLVTLALSEAGKFRQDPALAVPPLPALAPAAQLGAVEDDSHMAGVLRTHVTRGLNWAAWSFGQAAREAEAGLARAAAVFGGAGTGRGAAASGGGAAGTRSGD